MTKTKQPDINYLDGVPSIFSDAIDSLAEGFAIFDSNHQLVMCNQAYREMSKPLEHLLEPGVTREQIIRAEAELASYTNITGREEEWISQQLRTGTKFQQDMEMTRRDGSSCLVSTYPTKLGGLVVTCRDITEKKRVETEKSQSDDLVRMVMETNASAVIMSRVEDGEIIYRSPAAEEMYGVHKSAASHFANPQDRQKYLDAILPTGKVDGFQAKYKRANGEVFVAANSGRVTEYRGEKVIVSNVTDITKQLNADALVRTVLDASSAAVTMARIEDGKILYRSPAALSLLGAKKSAKEHYAEPEQREDFVRKIKAEGKIDGYTLDVLDANNEPFPASISGRIIEYDGEEAIVTSIVGLTEQYETEKLITQVLEACQVPIQMTSVATGEILFNTPETTALFGPVKNSSEYYVNYEERPILLKELREKGSYKNRRAQYRGADGRIFWSSQSARLLKFNGEEVIVSNTRDLTDDLAIEAELERQRDMLFQNEKMSALGELLAGVAHELNNPLSIVVGHSLMLREEAKEPEAIRRIEKISSAAERCAKIVKTFLAMARQQPIEMALTDINSVISTAVDVAGYGRGNETLSIKCSLDSKVPSIIADGDQITQVIINLIINAEQAITSSGIGNLIRVSTKLAKSGDTVKIVVKDNGPGIPKENIGRVFEPFFTTKDVGEGTGIGLAFCHRTIRSHEGSIWIDRTQTKGTKFVIKLPIVTVEHADNLVAETVPQVSRKIKALVVDDEIEVAELISEILVKDGFEVVVANSGSAAVEHLREGNYDLLLSDLNMPNTDGAGLYEALVSEFPDMLESTAFITGDTMGSASQSLLQKSQRPYLEKPVSPSELRELVHGILNDKKVNG